MKNNFYITTPIYYVNSVPHIGSAYTTLAADVLARYHRALDEKVFFLTGTDEHGAKIETKAKEINVEPEKFVDKVATKFKIAWSEFDINYDRFIRTTEEEHIKAVQKALQIMYDKGDIYQGKYEGLYCLGCEQFKSRRDLVDGKCPDHNTKPEIMSEKCYMFKLSKYQDILLRKIKNDEFKISPKERKNEIISFYEKEGLNDIAFSRKNVKWGIQLPWDKDQTAYVWADAFLNYLTGLGWDGNFNEFNSKTLASNSLDFFPPNVQFMSKDIMRVHTTIWPAMLLSLGLPLPKEIFVHGFFLVNGQKMSKSLKNVIRPNELINKYGVDASRYLLLSATPFGHDGDISWEKFDDKYNADLANGLGNLVARVSNLIEKNKITFKLTVNSNHKIIKQFKKLMFNFEFDQALKVLWDKFKETDEYLSRKAPWKMENKEEISRVLKKSTQNILDCAYLLKSFMPKTAEKIIKQFSAKQIKKEKALFPRI